jgi:hypothetical protein
MTAKKTKAAPKKAPPKGKTLVEVFTGKKPDKAAAPPIRERFNTDAAVAAAKRHTELRDRSRRWAELHADPKTRSKMDGLLQGLTPREERTVVLNGQRMACGMSPKDYS